jgi:aminomethyltransferase
MTTDALARTPLYALHKSLGAKLVPFAGYEMPVQYPTGIIAEHLHTRAKAGLFDVSHMGQVLLSGPRIVADLEGLVPADIEGLAQGRVRYTVFTNESGGILDDLMVGKDGDQLRLVVNAGPKRGDLVHLRNHLGGSAVRWLEDQALLALQGPASAEVLARFAPGIGALAFMSAAPLEIADQHCHVTRSGYTGEDGFEISVPAAGAEALARHLLAAPEVIPVGLGARDTLRLEAGLCLYGSDIDETTNVIEADLGWTIQARRRREGGFPGAAMILKQLAEGAPRRRVGIKLEGRQIARADTSITDANGKEIGKVTSGGFGPSVDGAIAMGYVATTFAAPGSEIGLVIRGATKPARIVPLPFVPHHYHQLKAPT